MRHRRKLNHLSRKSEHRRAMLANMAASLIEHKRITTTVAKAKALRVYVEPLITKAKNDTTHSRRHVFSYLQNKEAVAELFRDVAVKVGDRPGGYTRILKTGNRLGDNAEMCLIELVDYNENMLSTGETSREKTGTRRSRRSGKKKTAGEQKAVSAETAREITPETAEGTTGEKDEALAGEAVEEVAEDAIDEEPAAEEPAAEEPAADIDVPEKKVEETEREKPEDRIEEKNIDKEEDKEDNTEEVKK